MARKSKYANSDGTDGNSVWNAGLYMRLSREDGDRPESESVSSQRTIISQYLASRPEINAAGEYVDDGFTGTDFDRPAFKRLFADVKDKKINCVVVKDLSRFGRNYIESGKYLETVFPLLGVRFIAINDCVDSVENPSSVNSMMLPFKNIMNDEYCRDISAKVKSSLTARRLQGKFIGAFAPYGYKKDESDHNRLVIDECAAETVRDVFDMFLGGRSILGITRSLNQRGIDSPSAYRQRRLKGEGGKAGKETSLWSDRTVRRILSDRVYIGDLVQRKYEVVSYKVHVVRPVEKSARIVVENTHEPIILRGQFEKVQELLSRDTRVLKENRLSVFAGFLKCADCGRSMNRKTISQKHKRYSYYVCSTFRRLDRNGCTKHTIRSDVLEESVLAALNSYINLALDMDELERRVSQAENREKRKKAVQARITSTEKQAEKLNLRIADLYPDYKEGLIEKEQYLNLKQKYAAELEDCKNALCAYKKELESANGKSTENAFVAAFKRYKGLDRLTREVILELVDDIYVHEGGGIDIHVKFKDSLGQSEGGAGQSVKAVPPQDLSGKSSS